MRIRIESIFVGRPQSFTSEGDSKQWTSAIFKQSVDGPVHVHCENIAGDQQADLVHHGGRDKAICAYAVQNYAYWIREFPELDWKVGSFGENLALSGVGEPDICIGDSFEVGSCLLQVSQPRQPCWKLSRRWEIPTLSVRVQQTRRTGWYFRVLREGVIKTGQTMNLISRPHPQWTIESANEIMFAKPRNDEHDQELAACSLLSTSWRETLASRARWSEHEVIDRELRRLGN
ncbi:MAG: MOSC domain-containing protein [Planctomycetales bacterium]|nr:MOSC domain-containing protein [Planctomycetales bacterium]